METKVVILKALVVFGALGVAPGFAETVAEPSSTTATYGNWVVSCAVPAGAAAKVCETTTHLSVKGQDGAVHPLLQVAIGMPPGGTSLRVVMQVPGDVALRAPVRLSLDKAAPDPAANPAAKTAAPQDELVSASYFTCQPGGCLADADLAGVALARLLAAKSANVTFTAVAGAKQIVVPVSLEGFADAIAALGLGK